MEELDSSSVQLRQSGDSLWQRILGDNQLIGGGPLEKLLIGCMLIAAIDSVILLLA
jgi:hypothetical protein